MSLLTSVGTLLVDIGLSIGGSDVVDGGSTNTVSSEIKDKVNEIYSATVSETEGVSTSNQQGESTISGEGSTEEDEQDDDVSLLDKLDYIEEHRQVQKSSTTGYGVLDDFADSAPENQDTVAELKQALSEDNVNKGTLKTKLKKIFDQARIADKFATSYNEPNRPRKIKTEAIDVENEWNLEIAETFNELFVELWEAENSIEELQDDLNDKEQEYNEMKSEKVRIENDLEDYESTVGTSLNELEDYIIKPINYKNSNDKGKLRKLPSVIKKGKIRSQPLDDLIDYLEENVDTTQSKVNSELIDLLNDVSDGNVKPQEGERIFREINNIETVAKQVRRADVENVKARADRIQSRAEEQSGVVADFIARELASGKIHQILHKKPDDELVFAFDKVLNYFESILDTIKEEMTVDQSIDELREDIEDGKESYLNFKNNRPNYNHSIQELVHDSIDQEYQNAIELAANGETEIAQGRLYMIKIIYDVLYQVYHNQKALNLIENS